MVEQLDTAADAEISWGRKLVGGIVAGTLAAILMRGLMISYSSAIGEGSTMPLKATGALVFGIEALVAVTPAIAAGAGIQLGFSIALGVLFALLFRRSSLVLALPLGILVGIAVWLAMDFVRAALHGPNDGGADRADADGVFRCACAVRHRTWHDTPVHPCLQWRT